MALLLDCIGVGDVTDLTLNGGEGNLTMDAGRFPAVGAVTVREG